MEPLHTMSRAPILCVGGLDPAACAGIGADAHTIQALGGHAYTIASSITVQTPTAATQCKAQAPGLIAAQLRALLTCESPPKAAKVGLIQDGRHWMLLKKHLPAELPLVIDPVLSSSSGLAFSKRPTSWLRGYQQLASQANVITPNYAEWEALQAFTPATTPVLVTGNVSSDGDGNDDNNTQHIENQLIVNGEIVRRFSVVKQPGEYRGTGCRLASAIAYYLATGSDLESAIEQAMQTLSQAITQHYLLASVAVPKL